MTLSFHLVGVCGTGMGSLAGLLKSQGYEVRGSDENMYPPMSEQLRAWGITTLTGYDPRHLWPRPDYVVIGNAIRRQNPEATAARDAELPTLSMPQTVARFGIGEKHSVVVAGTHGKTTTTALIAHTLLHCGSDPSFLVGGAFVGGQPSFRSGKGTHFVIEGDEYDTAYFDKGPKFLHYKPRTAIIGALELDHVDIFADLAAVERAFASFIALLPSDGHLVIWEGAQRALALAERHGRCRISSFASGMAATLGIEAPLWGEMNARNTAAALTVLAELGLSREQIASAWATFPGVKKRLEVIGEARGVTVVEDFAHHPTAIALAIEAARQRWPGRRLWAVFEPRSATTRQRVFEQEITQALANADLCVVAGHERLSEVPEAERFRPDVVVEIISRAGRPAWHLDNPGVILAHLVLHTRPGDVVLVLSNGSFGGLGPKLVGPI